jgi:hypothetical protein
VKSGMNMIPFGSSSSWHVLTVSSYHYGWYVNLKQGGKRAFKFYTGINIWKIFFVFGKAENNNMVTVQSISMF